MSIAVKKVILWRREIENRPGSLAQSIKPLAKSGINLQILVGYAPHSQGQGAVEVYPVTDAKAEAAAKEAGLKPMTDVQCLLVEGEDHPGLAYDINLEFVMLTALGGKFAGIFGTKTAPEADKVKGIIEHAAKVAQAAR
jgi:hypothetical protein